MEVWRLGKYRERVFCEEWVKKKREKSLKQGQTSGTAVPTP